MGPGVRRKVFGDTVTYSAVGSGAGITDISLFNFFGWLVDFGASDAPLTSPRKRPDVGAAYMIPWALSPTGVVPPQLGSAGCA